MFYSNYYNHQVGNNRIYSKKNLLEMSLKDMLDKELELAYQYNTIGIPTEDELLDSDYSEEYKRYNDLSNSQAVNLKDLNQQTNNLSGGMLSAVPNRINTFQNTSLGNNNQNMLQSIGQNPIDRLSKNDENPEKKETENKILEPQEEPNLNLEKSSFYEVDKGSESELLNNKANRVTENEVEKDGIQVGGAVDINKNIIDTFEMIKSIPQDLLQKAKNKVFDYANKDFDKNKPMTIEEKIVQQGIEKPAKILLPMSSDATRNGMHDMDAARKAKNVTVYENLDSLEDTKIKDALRKLGVKDTDKGTVYGIGSRESQQFQKSPELDEYLTKVREDILAGKSLEDTSFYYDAEKNDIINNPEKFDRYATARKITVTNPKVDENGVFTCDLVDYSNFEDEPVTDVGSYLNKWGYKMQEKGIYKPHYQIIKVRKKVNW